MPIFGGVGTHPTSLCIWITTRLDNGVGWCPKGHIPNMDKINNNASNYPWENHRKSENIQKIKIKYKFIRQILQIIKLLMR